MKRFAWIALGIIVLLGLSLTTTRASNEKPRLVHPVLGLEPQTTFVVTKTTDSGDNNNAAAGTLRRALLDANNSRGLDAIVFDIAGSGIKTITVKNYLPDLTDDAGVIIDGTQSDDRIEIDGSQVCGHHGLRIISNNNVIRGLTINGVNCSGAGAAISIEGARGNVIVGNFLGTNSAGNAARPNLVGVIVTNGGNNTIGGTSGVTPGGACTGDCNLISGNILHGIVLDHSSGNHIVGNFVGVNAAGNGALANNENGVLIAHSPNNTVGGTSPQERNVISGNRVLGVEIGEVESHHNQVAGNFVGTNSAGRGIISSPGVGIEVDLGAHDNTIDGNVISGNAKFGVLVFLNASNNTISHNRVGISAVDDAAMGNGGKGIEVQTNDNKIIANRVAFSDSDGIRVKSGARNLISRNAIFSNRTFGINLGTDAFTSNDASDGDSGANNLQNFPTLTAAKHDGSSLTVGGYLNTRPNASYTVEFFHNAACDNTNGNLVGEGKTFLGSTQVTTNGSGSVSFSVPLSNAPNTGVVTATATDSANNTSEFSYCASIQTVLQPPSKPNLLAPINGQAVTTNPPRLDWSPSANAEFYKVFIRQDSPKGAKVHVNKNVRDDQYMPPTLPAGKTYYWQVRACNAVKCVKSAWSSFLLP